VLRVKAPPLLVPEPVLNVMAPPNATVEAVVAPEAIVTDPPAPVSPEPTDNEIAPPAPPVAAPVLSEIAPDEAAVVVPVPR
jgi:hypothetical protein